MNTKRQSIVAILFSLLICAGCTDSDNKESCDSQYVPHCEDDFLLTCKAGVVDWAYCGNGCSEENTPHCITHGNTEEPECTSHEECPNGTCVQQHCVPNGEEPECTSHEECPNGTCVQQHCVPNGEEPECTNSNQCPNGTCVQQHCVPNGEEPECINSDDCDDNYTCLAQHCVKNYAQCENEGDCDEGEICRLGFCAADMTPPTVRCETLTLSNSALNCERSGSGSKLVLRGDVLGLNETYLGGIVVVSGDTIEYVGCASNYSGNIDAQTVITCPDAVISPSFINGHDHVGYSNGVPGSWGDERFDHRNDWRNGIGKHTEIPGPQTKNNHVVELRALMSGTTAIFGSTGNRAGLARNIDQNAIHGIKAVYQTFPLGDSRAESYIESCTEYTYHSSVTEFDDSCPYGPHVAEGINKSAQNELYCLSGHGAGSRNIFKPNTAIVHGIAASPDIIAEMADNNVKLVWSPRTNISLYGDTAQAPLFDTMGVTVGLGTDWIYSGSATMLRELTCIDDLNRNYYGHYFTDYELWKMPTYNNAIAFGLEDYLGQLKAGLLADIAIFKQSPTKKLYRAVIEAENADVLFVMVGGKQMVGDENIMTSGTVVDVCGVRKRVDPAANGNPTTGGPYTYADIDSTKAYPLFFCGTPENEPTCIPQRTRAKDTTDQETTNYTGNVSVQNDADGDGILDQYDNCPNMFNPIRPMDLNRKQSDYDGDGIGDICDRFPACAKNDDSCGHEIYEKDTDSDGVPDLIDNCIQVPNKDQSDKDHDGIGDLCDLCPEFPNPGQASCPIDTATSIIEANGMITTECTSTVATCNTDIEIMTTGHVTALTSNGFFIQDTTNPGAPWSGIYVATKTEPTVAINDGVKVQGKIGRTFGMPTLTATSYEKQGATKTVSATSVQASAVTTGGADALAYTGMLVSIEEAKVLDNTDDPNLAYYMYKVRDKNGGEIYLDDYIWRITPVPVTDEVYRTVTGVLVLDFKNHKIAPRSASDLVK